MKKKVQRINESQLRAIVAESVKKVLLENDDRGFLPSLWKTYQNLHKEYETWQYANYKPQGMDEVIEAIIVAQSLINDIISNLDNNGEYYNEED